MKSVDKFLQASKTDNLCVTGTKIGEQAFLLSKLNQPIFFIVGDSETAYKAYLQLQALNKRVAILDGLDNPYIISKYQSNDNKIKLLDVMCQMACNVLDIVVLTPQALNLKLSSKDVFL